MLGHRRGARTGRTSRSGAARPRQRFVRKAERIYVDAHVFLRRSGKLNLRVRAYDASRFGCRIEFVERPTLDERVWIKFDGLNPIEGMVCWVDGFVAGIEFTQAIHPAVFESLMPRLR
jgi:hypothetical protein